MLSDRTVLLGGNPKKLGGTPVKVGDPAPDFTAIGPDSKTFKLSDLKGKVVIISSVPSLDTGVCDKETRRFNELASELGDDVRIVTVSVDLPPAQKRWCAAAGVKNILVVSDHKDLDFGTKYGVIMPEVRLLARCVFVVDREGIIRYIQLVPEIAQEPNYDEVLEATKKLL